MESRGGKTLADEFLTEMGVDEPGPVGLFHSMSSKDPHHHLISEKVEVKPEDEPVLWPELVRLLQTIGAAPSQMDLLTSAARMQLAVRAAQEREGRVLRDLYAAFFRDLEKIVPGTTDYARVVQRIGGGDAATASFTDLLGPQLCLSIALTATSCGATRMPEGPKKRAVLQAVDRVLTLDCACNDLLAYVARAAAHLTPNLSVLVGPTVAAQLIAAAGGLQALVTLPATTLQILGASKRADLGGMSTGASVSHAGYIRAAPVVVAAPDEWKEKTCRLLSSKAALAARLDLLSSAPDSSAGQTMLAEITKKLDKLQEPAAAREEKALPLPVDAPRKRRGGGWARKLKAKYAQTDVSRLANRVAFGVEQEDEIGLTGKGLGMLGKSTPHSSIRVSSGIQKKSSLKK